MKKGKSKKLVAWLLAFALLMSPTTGFRAFAEDGDGTQEAAVSTTADDPTAGDEAAVTEGQDSTDDSANPVTDQETTADQNDPAAEGEPQEPVDGNEPAGTGEPQEPVNGDEQAVTGEPAAGDEQADPEAEQPAAEEEAAEEEPAEPEYEDGGVINNLFIEEHALQAPGELNAIISFGEGEEQLESVKLILTGDDGRQSEIPLTQKVLHYYQFTKTYDSQEAGTYRLTSFIYELDGHKKRIDLKNTGISAEFTVSNGEEGDCADETGISVTALTSDDISTDLTYEIENTIQEAAQEAVDNVNEGSVALGSSSTDRSYSRAGVSAELTAMTDRAVALGSYSAEKAYTGTAAMVIVLDPGHGGTDPGSSNKEAGLVESELNWKVANYCKTELEKYNGIQVYLTRNNEDQTMELDERVEFAKSKKATLFVSIHMNSATTTAAKGAEVYYPNANGNYGSDIHEDGKEVAQNILDELVKLGLTNRNVKYKDSSFDSKDVTTETIRDENGNIHYNTYNNTIYNDGKASDYYYVIRQSKRNGFPGIIVEHAFITNTEDAEKLKKESFLKELGVADAKGILKYCDVEADYSPVYNYAYYVTHYSDTLKEEIEEGNLAGRDEESVRQYFINYGMARGHQASEEFNVLAYRNRYQDLRLAYGNDYKLYYMHYINYGKAEGRNGREEEAKDPDKMPNVDVDAIFDGVNYADVYDFDYYVEHYPDLKAAFGNNRVGALEHFVLFGMSEGRQAKGTFNVAVYKNKYIDLQKAFGSSWKSYYLHYIEHGKKEGRTADDTNSSVDSDSKIEGVTKYRGLEFKQVYNFNYYIEKYPDIKAAFGNNPEKALEHFVQHGMEEGRSGNADFNVHAYKNNYSDLRAAFGDKLEKYYIHYLMHGIEEGRECALVTVTTYRGVDYSAVYSFEYYIGRYPDLNAVFANDPAGALQHFVTNGINEDRQAHENFNIVAYKNNYGDLRAAFGNNNKAYVDHYISNGIVEGRNAKSFTYHQIAGSATTTVNQMVTYFLAKGSYPTYFANNTNVRTIKDFCQIYWEECDAEGIDPAVAFCQAMKETNFLKFTGDVKITQFNFAGLGATGNGVSGLSFSDIRTGVRAQVQHLKAYATKEGTSLANPCVDPRFNYVQRYSAPYVEWLGIQENPIPGCGWAAEAGYGNSIVRDYMNVLTGY